MTMDDPGPRFTNFAEAETVRLPAIDPETVAAMGDILARNDGGFSTAPPVVHVHPRVIELMGWEAEESPVPGTPDPGSWRDRPPLL
jgi:hypothetical protein